MKRINEVGLELIKIDNQLLLVDNIDVSDSFWVLWRNEVYSNKIHSIVGVKYDECKRVITSTKSYGGIPLLVIEDDAEKFAFDDVVKTAPNSYLKDVYKGFFKRGYNKAKEEYQFTEEDLRKIFIHGKQFGLAIGGSIRNGQDKPNEKEWLEESIESITKKELWIEVELEQIKVSDKTGYEVNKVIPKIAEGKIKGIWK